MKIILNEGNQWVLVFEQGDNFLFTFQTFLREQKITAGSFTALGAAAEVEIGRFVSADKNYVKQKYSGELEVLQLTGNIAESGEEVIVHAHATLSGEDFSAYGGHLFKLIVKPVLEVHLTTYPNGLMRRDFSNELGLKVLSK